MLLSVSLLVLLVSIFGEHVPATASDTAAAAQPSRAEIESRKAMAQSMMAELKENMLRRKMAKGWCLLHKRVL